MASIDGEHKYHTLPVNDDVSDGIADHVERASRGSSCWTRQRYRILKMCCILAATSISFVLACRASLPSRHAAAYRRQPLRFTSEGTFQISVFADLHFGENAWDTWGPQQDWNSLRIMGDILDAEQQNLVVLNGDLITGENTYASNSSEYLDQIVGPIVQRGLPFASTYGNHDSALELSREQILQRERRYRESWTSQMIFGPHSGVTNYYLEVFPHQGGGVPCLLLWFFDSRGGHYYQQKATDCGLVGQPNWVDQSVVDWFLATNAALMRKYGKVVPSLAFVHIPTNASAALQTEVGVDPHRQPGINDDYVLSPQAQGWCPNGSEGCPYGGQDEAFLEAMASTQGLIALFSGHDHGDTWCYRWDRLVPGMKVAGGGTALCFNQHSGYGGYGAWERGARQILVREEELRQQRSAETWIRLESGRVVGAVSLNATFGEDEYEATPNTKTNCPTCDYAVISSMPDTSQ